MEAYYAMASRAMPIGRGAAKNISSFFSFSSSKPIVFLNQRSSRKSFAALHSYCSTTTGASTTNHEQLHPITEYFKADYKSCRFETVGSDKISGSANGVAVMAMGGAEVLSTVNANAVASAINEDGCIGTTNDSVRVGDILPPLNVDYEENCKSNMADDVLEYYTTFIRPEVSNVIDRAIRPLFPAGFNYHHHEVSIKLMATFSSTDFNQDHIVMAANATSAALMLSDIPWGGPVGVVRVGRLSGQHKKFIINPSISELRNCDFNMVYACTQDKTLMIDVQADEMPEGVLEAAFRLAHDEAVKYIEPQVRLAANAGKQKNKDYKLSIVSDLKSGTLEKLKSLAELGIEANLSTNNSNKNLINKKFKSEQVMNKITQYAKEILLECSSRAVIKDLVRRRIFEEGVRVDGRRIDKIRPCSVLLKEHEPSTFSLGDAKVQCNVMPGDDERELDSFGFPKRQGYEFPPFSINELGQPFSFNEFGRKPGKELGHGNSTSSSHFVKKALLAVLPYANYFPYHVYVNTKSVMDSDSNDGSSGCATNSTICGVSLALMDAGIPIHRHVASVSMGLVSEVDPSTGTINDYRILTDILGGLEDHLGVGDMDLKIAGTRTGVTAMQLDLNPSGADAGIPLNIICECLKPALQGRFRIIRQMERVISVPRQHTLNQRDWNWNFNWKFPVATYFSQVCGPDDEENENLRRLKESNDHDNDGDSDNPRRKIEEETGVKICVRDGDLTILAKNYDSMAEAKEMVVELINDGDVTSEYADSLFASFRAVGDDDDDDGYYYY